VISGSADAARQILTSIAASVITVVGIVFSITIVTLTLASTQFGPRMLRNFIRDRTRRSGRLRPPHLDHDRFRSGADRSRGADPRTAQGIAPVSSPRRMIGEA
jgi:hypothetical protein